MDHYKLNRPAIRSRLKEFDLVPPSKYFFELAYCLLTPQSKAAYADAVISKLHSAGFDRSEVDPLPILYNKEHYIRFHRTKSSHLIKMKDQFPQIAAKISEKLPAFEMREWLVKNVTGLGYKEATHFLRNIGKSGNLAILDRHILRSLKKSGVVRKIPGSLTKKHYLTIERKLNRFSKKLGISLNELDLTLWSMGNGEIRK